MCVYRHTSTHIYIYIYVYMYTCIEREREREIHIENLQGHGLALRGAAKEKCETKLFR